jgi:hypothetical protein
MDQVPAALVVDVKITVVAEIQPLENPLGFFLYGGVATT